MGDGVEVSATFSLPAPFQGPTKFASVRPASRHFPARTERCGLLAMRQR